MNITPVLNLKYTKYQAIPPASNTVSFQRNKDNGEKPENGGIISRLRSAKDKVFGKLGGFEITLHTPPDETTKGRLNSVKEISKTPVQNPVKIEVKEKIEFPSPNFNFDFEQLKNDFGNISNVDAEWVEENTSAVVNLLAFAGFKIPDNKSLHQEFGSYEAISNLANALINNGDIVNRAEVKYAKEKKAYVDSVMKYLNVSDKEATIKAINAIEKYGTWEHGDKLGLFFGDSDEDIIRAVVRAIAATGEPKRALHITGYIRHSEHNYSVETYLEILNSAAKLGDAKALKQPEIMLDPIKKLLNHPNEEVRKTAQKTLDIVTSK